MRGFFRFLFGFVFVITTFSLVMIFTLKSTVLTYEYVQTRLEKSDVYTKIYNAIPELTKMVVSEAEKGELKKGENPALSGEQIGKVIASSVSPEILKEKTERFLLGFYNWIYGEGNEIPEISFSDIKPKMEILAATEMNIPVEFIRSESSDFKVPEKLTIEPIPPLLLIRRIYANYNLTFYTCLLLSITCLIITLLLAGKGLSNRIKKPATPMIVTSIWLSLTAGVFWLFFNAGNLLYKMVAEKLSSSPQSETIVYSLLNGIILDITFFILKIAGILLAVGIILKVIGHFVKKQEAEKIQEEPK